MATPAPTTQEQTQITTGGNQRAIDKFKAYAKSQAVEEAFANVLGGPKLAQVYIGSVIIAVYNSEALQACTPKSIMVSAMRAASLRLSVDSALKQAHLVPFKGEATLIVDYHGLVELMHRTGLYETIHVAEVYEGETVKIQRMTGNVDIEGERTGDKIIGWCAYFKTKFGNEKYLYMTTEECMAHGKKYSKAFSSPRSGWQTDPQAMCRKTALRCLANKWGTFSPYAAAVLKSEDGIIDGVQLDLPGENEVTPPSTAPARPESSNLAALGFGGPIDDADHTDAFTDWARGASRHDLEVRLSGFNTTAERHILEAELTTRANEIEPLLPLTSPEIVNAVAQSWDEAPNTVRDILAGMFVAGVIADPISASEARLIKRPE